MGSFAVVGPSERPKDPALVPALPTFAQGRTTTYSSSILERAAACTVVLALLLKRSGRDIHSSSSTLAECGRGAKLALVLLLPA